MVDAVDYFFLFSSASFFLPYEVLSMEYRTVRKMGKKDKNDRLKDKYLPFLIYILSE